MENHNNSTSGSGTSSRSTSGFSTRFVQCTRDFPPEIGSNVLGTTQGDQQQQPKGLGGKSDFLWWRKVGAAKGKLGIGGECDRIKVKKDPKKMKGNNNGERAKLQEMLRLFRKRFEEITEMRNEGDKGRVDLKVMNELTSEKKITQGCSLIIGPVPRVEVGDRFQYRVELVIVGLHKHFERGIDTMEWGTKNIATCVVANEGHSDNMNDPNVLTYIGEGGNSRATELEKPSDQELKGGNLALWESKLSNSPVRVVKGFKLDRLCGGRVVQRNEYVYDGLYEVQTCEKKQGLLRNWIFEFKLFRCPGQHAVSLGNCKRK